MAHPHRRMNSAEQAFLAELRTAVAAMPLKERTYAGRPLP
jgi:hypothetical protein